MDRIVGHLKPMKDKVFVHNLETGEIKRQSGLIIRDDNMTDRGIRPRWCQVFRVGDDVEGIEVGEWLYVEHGRWSLSFNLLEDGTEEKIWMIDYPKAVLLVADKRPVD
jgi:hypothetical protein